MSSELKIGVVMDPIDSIHVYKDTTLALLLAAKKSGHSLTYMEIGDLFLHQGEAKAFSRRLNVFDDDNHWFDLSDQAVIALEELDVILMRKDPPFDSEYIYATYILEAAEKRGTLVVNRPQSLRDCNEKVFATQFPQCTPPVIVSRHQPLLRDFHRQYEDVIYKPLDGMGGAQIFRCKADDPNVSVILETLTGHGSRFIMAQKYIPEIRQGDKRVLVVNGKAAPYALARLPAEGETRGNIAAGGTGVAQPLSERDEWIVDQVSSTLVDKGLLFVGLDIIGDYLTEINVTSPTCVREIDTAFGTDIGTDLIREIEKIRLSA